MEHIIIQDVRRATVRASTAGMTRFSPLALTGCFLQRFDKLLWCLKVVAAFVGLVMTINSGQLAREAELCSNTEESKEFWLHWTLLR